MEGRREEGGEAGEGCGGRGGRRVWVRRRGGGSVMGRGQWREKGRRGRREREEEKGGGGSARAVRWQGHGEAGRWQGGWSAVVVAEEKRGVQSGRGGNVDAGGARVSRGLG
nr:glycine-rich protein DOT1-like [Arachis hypogaea]